MTNNTNINNSKAIELFGLLLPNACGGKEPGKSIGQWLPKSMTKQLTKALRAYNHSGIDNGVVMFGPFAMWQQKKYDEKSIFIVVFHAADRGGMPSKSYAIASPDDAIKSYVGFSMLYDSNFLRQSDDDNLVLVTGTSDKSEFIKQVATGFDMDWTISRQHIIIKANADQNWFQNFTSLDYIGWNSQAQWNWQMGNDLNGEIGYENIQVLSGFVQLNTLVPNLENNQRYFTNAGYLFHPSGKIKFGVFRTENLFADKSRQFSNNIEDNAEFNLQYLSPTGSILGLRLLATDGQYPHRQFTVGDCQDNAYTRMNYAVTGDWHASSRTRIDGLVGYTQQHYTHLSVRDFAGITGRLNLHWQASDKARLELSAIRDIYPAQNLLANFLLIQGVEFNPTWQFSPKIAHVLPTATISGRRWQF